jgi:hypothetical protein
MRPLRDAERVGPIIARLISQRGCTSYRKLADALNYLAVETPRHRYWYASSVKNTMAAAGCRSPACPPPPRFAIRT